ncbi:hypothetical protein EV424DRAFT_1097172 [Suillus variegatus]|nr:hypothetical protein EV424DRAFT_1097172 [Suillus variegatus]
MHFSLLAIVVALTASMSVNAATPCLPGNDPEATCQTVKDCCDGYICFYLSGTRQDLPVTRLRIEPAARETRRDIRSHR